ncbi:DUF3483 domain-containing protein [Marinivivus vitaminiproducens]|uniref:DUF3483 domain-containing protein n=1 Tax=Marinivivus vitaminiproducens TaxID=3035935 RepID=UPI00279B8176|nr:DUF3483 domain-containing protein [Geminicoccaceae bacterium SCSIO 64248]
MIGPASAALILVLALATLVLAVRQTRRWRIGAPADVDLIAGVRALPGRYLHDVHDVVARRPFNARFHALLAGGLIAGCLLLLILPLAGGRAFWALLALVFAAMLTGAVMVAWRRTARRPDELSGGRFDWLPIALIAFSLGFGLLALDQAAGGVLPVLAAYGLLAVAAVAGGALVRAIWRGPMKHALHGTLHLVAHPRPKRFGKAAPKGEATALAPLDLDADKLGRETPTDFAWNRLLGFDACVECGRCEAVCPAYAASQPLNPKALIQDLVGALEPGAGAYAGHGHPGRPLEHAPGGPLARLIGDDGVIAPETLWSCTTCRACVEACPMMIEHVDAVIDLRRFQALELGAVPGKAAETLEEIRATDTVSGRDPARRLDWATDLRLPVATGDAPVPLLLWLGEAAFDLRGQRTLRALVRLLRLAEVDFAVLGGAELDCGDVARRLGDEATFQDLARRNIATLDGLGVTRIVTADPHALHVLRNEYPALGGRYDVVHHSALLADLTSSGRLAAAEPGGRTVTYHDPCYLGRYNGEIDAPRALLAAAGARVVEMKRSGLNSFCCGGGGGAPLTDIPGKARIADLRMAEAAATGADVVAVACPNCALMLEGVVGPRPEVADLAELVLQAQERAA